MEELKAIDQPANGKRDYPQLVIAPNLDAYQEDTDDEIELRDLFAVLKRRWRPLLGVTTVTFAGLMTWYMLRPPTYERSFSMAVEPLEKLTGRDSGSALGSIPGGGLPGMALPGGLGGADYSSLIAVLQSELLLQPVLQTAQKFDPGFDQGKLLSLLTIEQFGQSKILDISFRASDPDLVQQVTAELQAAYLAYSTETQQTAMIRRLNDLNTQVDTQRQVVARTQASLIEFQGENQILDLKSASEALEQRRSEVLVEQQNTRLTLNITLEKYNNLQNQLGLRPAEAVVVANLSESPTYQKLLADYRELESQIALESARFREDTPIIQALRDQQNQLRPLLQMEAERNVGASLAAAATVNPQTLSYQGTVGRGLVSQLVTAVNEIQMLEAQDQSLRQIYQTLSAELDNLVNLSSGFREIERNLTLAEAALQRLLAAQQELKLQLEAETNPWIIVSGYDLSIPLEPESRLLRGLVLGLVASTVLGLGTVFVLESLDRSYPSAEKAAEGTQLPLLGVVPWVDPFPPLVVTPYASSMPAAVGDWASPGASRKLSAHTTKLTAFETAFQTLSANLRLLSAHSPGQIVAIASADAMEGKTTIATYLAVASAQAGRKVLLVDGDLRAATVAQRFGLGPPVPKPEAFRPSEARMPEIQSVLDDGTLDVLQGANTHGMAPMGFLASSQFELFLKQCRTHYDLILLDTPTSLDLAETKILSQYADGLLVVIQLGQTDRERVNAALKDFRVASKTPLLGLVANGVETR
jgi:succinoglycan biosynthesis transport protein ExoP